MKKIVLKKVFEYTLVFVYGLLCLKCYEQFLNKSFKLGYATHYNDIHHCDIQHKDVQHNYIQHNDNQHYHKNYAQHKGFPV